MTRDRGPVTAGRPPDGGAAGRGGPRPPADRAAYLGEVCRLLWPEPARVTGYRTGRGAPVTAARPAPPAGLGPPAAPAHPARPAAPVHPAAPAHPARPAPPAAPVARVPTGPSAASEFVVLPGLQRPRLLVPADRRAAAAALRRYGEPGSWRALLGTRALSLIMASGLGCVTARDRLRVLAPAGAPTIEAYLQAELGLEIRVSMHIGAARANRKPVLQLLTPAGDTVGFAKIGISPLTRDLIRAERDALTRLGRAGLTGLAVPRVLHYGSWQDLTVMVLSPLPVWQRRTRLSPGRLALAMREVAAVAGISHEPLAASGYWATLGRRLAAADDTGTRRAVADALGRIGSRAGAAVLPFGAWHGDWTPWNMASTRGGLLVWDWERFTVGVPLGFDALHHWLQAQVDTRAAGSPPGRGRLRRARGPAARPAGGWPGSRPG